MSSADVSYASPAPLRRTSTNASQRQQAVPSKSLYVSHFLSTWNTRGFEFGAVLFLATIYPGTLMPMSIYALIRAAAAILLSPQVGNYIDRGRRLSVVRASIVGQRVAVTISCVGFLVLLLDIFRGNALANGVVFVILVVLACVEKLYSVMNTVAIERDWVIVIADKDETVLQEMNSQMRRIDLFCKLISPLVIALLDGGSSKIAVMVTLVVNLLSVGFEYFFIARVFNKTSNLARTRSLSVSQNEVVDEEMTDIRAHRESAKPSMLASIKAYTNSTAFLPSLSLSMLYLTVLSFSGQMVTFLLAVPHPKLNSSAIGLLRTVAAAFEISSTFLAPQLMSTIGPVRSGIWCLSWQIACLTCAVGTLWSSTGAGSVLTIPVFIGAVILSRVGLWSFDLVAQLLIQNSIDSSHRGSFSSIEASLQNFFELCTFATTIIFSKPEQFKYPALISLAATVFAAILYAKFVRDRRGHLIHMPECLKLRSDAYRSVESDEDMEGAEDVEGARTSRTQLLPDT